MRYKRFTLGADGTVTPVEAPAPKNIKPLPHTATDLIRELDEIVPPQCIGQGQSAEEAHRYAGKRELVEHLLSRLALTNDPTRPVLRTS